MTAAAQRGTTTVSVRAVRRIAGRAAAEALPGRDGARSASAAAVVRGQRAEVSLGVTLPYPAPLADTVRHVQRHVAERTGQLTGLVVPSARVYVTSLTPPRSPHPQVHPAPKTGVHEGRTPRRWWSQRRIPVAVLTAVAAVGCGALAVDLVQTHTAHRTAAPWRISAVHWLSGHGPGDPSVAAGGALLALAGSWLLVLALTPGRRRQSTVRTPAARVDAAVDRSAVETLVGDAVGGVAGIDAVRVRVRRRRVTVRAGLAFGDRASVQTAVTATARGALTACRLRRGPQLRVTVTPQPLWQPPAPATDATGTTPQGNDGGTPTVPMPNTPEPTVVSGAARAAGSDQ
jgi:uncharacterized alkaline shock family protein YloU